MRASSSEAHCGDELGRMLGEPSYLYAARAFSARYGDYDASEATQAVVQGLVRWTRA